MDRLDADLVRTAYHPDAIDDHVGFAGSVEGFLAWAFDYHATQVRHQHYVTNHSIDLDGDLAHVETYYFFIGTMRDETAPLTMTGGRYLDRFERRDGRWAIATRVLTVEWMTEAPSLLNDEIIEHMTARCTVARDRSDSSYDRPLEAKDL